MAIISVDIRIEGSGEDMPFNVKSWNRSASRACKIEDALVKSILLPEDMADAAWKVLTDKIPSSTIESGENPD